MHQRGVPIARSVGGCCDIQVAVFERQLFTKNLINTLKNVPNLTLHIAFSHYLPIMVSGGLTRHEDESARRRDDTERSCDPRLSFLIPSLPYVPSMFSVEHFRL